MEIIQNAISWFIGLGGTYFVPIVMLVIGLVCRAGISRSVTSALKIGNRPDRFKYDYRLLRPGDAASDRSTFPAPQCRLFHSRYWLWKLYGRLELGWSTLGDSGNFGGEYSLCDTQIDADTVGGYVEYLAR